MLESTNWEKLEWGCYAAQVVDQITQPGEALKWTTRNHVLEIKNRFLVNIWQVVKVSRESNSIADCVAKLALHAEHDLFFVNCTVGSLPPPLQSAVLAELAVARG